MTQVPALQFVTGGIIPPAESEIKAGLWADMQDAFGGGLNEIDTTPQGQLVTALTAILGANNDLFLKYANLIDPAFSEGRMQEAIGRIYYLTRLPALATIVTATCVGAIGTIIPAGALAQANDGTIFQCLSAVTIPSTGSVSATFQAIETGPIACPAGTLTTIYRVVPGWDAITNDSDGTVGRAAETPAQFEARRAASVAANAKGFVTAIRGAVLNVPGVVDAYVTENPTSGTVTVGSVDLDPRSLYVSVYGGTDEDVARAIWSKKPPGCAYNGDTTVTIADTASGYSLPYPSYDVAFQRATGLPIFIAISIADNGLVPSDAANAIKAAVVAAFNGDDGGPAARIGGTIYAIRFAGPAQSVGSWCQVISIAIGTSASPTGSEVVAGIDRKPTITADNITVTLV